jgi:hypothetical protein
MKMTLKLKINPIREFLGIIFHPIKATQVDGKQVKSTFFSIAKY